MKLGELIELLKMVFEVISAFFSKKDEAAQDDTTAKETKSK